MKEHVKKHMKAHKKEHEKEHNEEHFLYFNGAALTYIEWLVESYHRGKNMKLNYFLGFCLNY